MSKSSSPAAPRVAAPPDTDKPTYRRLEDSSEDEDTKKKRKLAAEEKKAAKRAAGRNSRFEWCHHDAAVDYMVSLFDGYLAAKGNDEQRKTSQDESLKKVVELCGETAGVTEGHLREVS